MRGWPQAAPPKSADRSHACCSWCGRKLKKATKAISEKRGDYGDGHFCGLRCGFQFAVAVCDGIGRGEWMLVNAGDDD